MKVKTSYPAGSGLWKVLLECGHSLDDVQSTKPPREVRCEQCEKTAPDAKGQASLFDK